MPYGVERACKLDPENSLILIQLGENYQKTGEVSR
jgi:hypothetical protein